MPETAPLDVNEHAVGYELDSITLRNIASVRFVRHHEWLDHVLGSPLPNASIIPPNIMQEVDTSNLESRMKQLDAEITELESEKAKGWQFHVNDTKAAALSQAIYTLRKDFGNDSYKDVKRSIEDLLDVKIEKASMMRPVEVTYDRKAALLEQVKREAESQTLAQAQASGEASSEKSSRNTAPNTASPSADNASSSISRTISQPQFASPSSALHTNSHNQPQAPQAQATQLPQQLPILQQSQMPRQHQPMYEHTQMYQQQQQQQQTQQPRMGHQNPALHSPHLVQPSQQLGSNSPTSYGQDTYSHQSDVEMQ